MMNRRVFVRTALAATIPASAGLVSYGLYEAGWVQVTRPTIAVPNLPPAFCGKTIAFLTDLHHGPFTSLDYLASVVRTTVALRPDLIVLGGDYSLKNAKYIGPCFEVLSGLKAPWGVYGVLGNHDYWHGLEQTRAGLKAAKVEELTNRGLWIEWRGARLWLAGVDDFWMGKVDPKQALDGTTTADAVVMISHNPDVAERMRDRRVGLMLSGHTHGGQCVFPDGTAPFVPSIYGRKYLRGLVQAPNTQVYVSRGLGTAAAPVRCCSRPELTLVTLSAES